VELWPRGPLFSIRSSVITKTLWAERGTGEGEKKKNIRPCVGSMPRFAERETGGGKGGKKKKNPSLEVTEREWGRKGEKRKRKAWPRSLLSFPPHLIKINEGKKRSQILPDACLSLLLGRIKVRKMLGKGGKKKERGERKNRRAVDRRTPLSYSSLLLLNRKED